MGFLINKYVPNSGAEFPPGAFQKIFEDGNLEAFDSLLKSYTNYTDFVNNALTIEVPISASSLVICC